MKSIENLYKRLGISRRNTLWSWGVSTKKYVLLQVWQDEHRNIDGKRCFILLQNRGTEYDSNGMEERVSHLEEIRNGKPCFLLVCLADNPTGAAQVTQFQPQRGFETVGAPFQLPTGEILIEWSGRISISEFEQKFGNGRSRKATHFSSPINNFELHVVYACGHDYIHTRE